MDFFYFDENIRQASIYLGSEFYTFKNWSISFFHLWNRITLIEYAKML
jgi:hypothetical protein